MTRCKRCALLLAPSRAGLVAHALSCKGSKKAKAFFFAPMDYFRKKEVIHQAETYLAPYFVG